MVKDKQKGTKLIMRGQQKERTTKEGTKNKRQTKGQKVSRMKLGRDHRELRAKRKQKTDKRKERQTKEKEDSKRRQQKNENKEKSDRRTKYNKIQ